ncbi:MAG: toll/interleukin-1 receptor domain-containing protein [Methylocella sp.]
MAHDVFLSYSSKEKYAADAACAVLERNGIRVWMAPRDILPGLGWGTSIIEAINNARGDSAGFFRQCEHFATDRAGG